MKVPKKILNDPRHATAEMMEGLVLANDGRIGRVDATGALYRTDMPDGKAALLIGGGSGHEPIFGGFIGHNLADGAACGEVFAAPGPDTICAAARAINRGKGIIFLYCNYAGDNMNFDIAAELLGDEGIETRTVRVRDDVAAAPPERLDDRRGIAGAVLVVKVAGGAAAEIADIAEIERIIRKAEANVRSMGVAVAPGSLPETGRPTFELGDDEIEVGMGAHGEAGVKRQKMVPADAITDQMMEPILRDIAFSKGDEVALLINNLGASTMMELLIVNRRVRQILAREDIAVHRTFIGPWFTSQEMAGFSISLMKLDAELKHFIDLPCASFGFTSL